MTVRTNDDGEPLDVAPPEYMTEAEIQAEQDSIVRLLVVRPKLIGDYGEASGPHWTVDACALVAQAKHINWHGLHVGAPVPLGVMDDNGDPIMMVPCKATFTRVDKHGRTRSIEAHGSGSTDEPGILAKRSTHNKKGETKKSRTSFGESVQAATDKGHARMFRHGIEMVSGVPGITWNDMERCGITREMVRSLEFGKGPKPYLMDVYGGKIRGLTKQDLADATASILGSFKMTKDMTDDEAGKVADALKAYLAGLDTGGGNNRQQQQRQDGPPPQDRPQDRPQERPPAAAPAQQDAAPDDVAPPAMIAELKRLAVLLTDDTKKIDGKKKLIQALQKAGYTDGTPSRAMAAQAMDMIAAWCAEAGVPDSEINKDPF